MKRLLSFSVLWFLLIHASLAAGFPAKEVYEQVSKGVVLIIARSQDGPRSMGSGSIISRDGLIVTNAHVVYDENSSKVCSEIKVFLKPAKVTGKFGTDLMNGQSARLLKYSLSLDLALLKLDNLPGNSKIIELADPEEIQIGEEVIAIGHPEQGGLWSLTYGRISGSIENFSDVFGKDVFQTDTCLNRGNSGGPLLDQRGYMVAVNSNIARLTSDNLPITGVNFAIKSSVVKTWLDKEGYRIAYGQNPLGEKDFSKNAREDKDSNEELEIAAGKKENTATEAERKDQPEVKEEDAAQNSTEHAEQKDTPKAQAAEVIPKDKGREKNQKQDNTLKDKTVQDKNSNDKTSQDKTLQEDAQTTETAPSPGAKFQTPVHPYDIDDLFKAVEAELEDMMKDMRNKIRKRW